MDEERSRTHCQHLGKTYIGKLRSWGLPAAVVYSNNMGALHTYGSPVITSIVDQHRHEFFARDDYQEVVMHENVTDQRLLLPSSTIHWSNAFSNLLEVLPNLLLKHLVALPVLTGVMQIKHQCGG